jgi:U3 small nucleolar RNA-associated protein 22
VSSSPADVLIQFEGSGRWPDDVVAIQRTKIAFLLKVGSLLEEADTSITTRVGLEHGAQVLQNCAYLDVSYETGATFRLRIQTDREQALLDRITHDKSTTNRGREEALQALSQFKRTATQLPLHTQSIVTHCTRFPLLGPTIRLFKTWLDRHMLLSHMTDEFAELLCVRSFLQPYPWTPPSSAMTGFLRTLLFVSKWDWRQSPLIVDFSGAMTNADISAINTRVEAWRKIDPAMNRTVVVAATNHDVTGTAFTTSQPTKMVAARLTALSRSACKLVKDQGIDLDPRSLFATSTVDYDFVLHLSPKFASKHTKKDSKQKFKNLEVQKSSGNEKLGMRGVELYLQELRTLYADRIVFFHDIASGSVITGLWNPQMVAPRPFKVNLGYASRIAEEGDDDITIDKSAILSEICRLGGDMVARIEINRP